MYNWSCMWSLHHRARNLLFGDQTLFALGGEKGLGMRLKLVSTISPKSLRNPKHCQTLLFALGGERSRSSEPASVEDAIAIAGWVGFKQASASKPQPSVLAVVWSMSNCACAKHIWSLSILYYYVSTITIQYLLSILLVYWYYHTTLANSIHRAFQSIHWSQDLGCSKGVVNDTWIILCKWVLCSYQKINIGLTRACPNCWNLTLRPKKVGHVIELLSNAHSWWHQCCLYVNYDLLTQRVEAAMHCVIGAALCM